MSMLRNPRDVAIEMPQIARSASGASQPYDSSRAAADRMRAGIGEDDPTFKNIALGGPAPSAQAPQTARVAVHQGWPASNSMVAQAEENARKARVNQGREADLEAAVNGGLAKKRWWKRVWSGYFWWGVVGVCIIVFLGVVLPVVIRSSK